MKRILPILMLICLLLSACGSGESADANAQLAAEYEALQAHCDNLEAANADLQAQVEDLQSQVEALTRQVEELESGSAGAFCNLFVNSWEEKDGTLTLTSALFHVQVPADATIESAQLVLSHNGTEIARADITLESGEAQGSYQVTLTDTWFILPELAEDDELTLHPEVTLSSGMQLTGGTTSWFASPDGLDTVVG